MDFLAQRSHWHLDELMLQCAWPFSKLASVLLQLEFKGLLRQKPGQQVERC
jgi:predicted Rossmann fold nucleotide-binding protein DprA/Smf involved in DNA uptake